MQHSALPRVPTTEPDSRVAKGSLTDSTPTAPDDAATLRDAELVAPLPVIAFLPALLIVLALAAVFLWQTGDHSRELEFAGAGIAVLTAFLVPRRLAMLAVLAALADVVVLEHHNRRLDFRHFSQLVFYGAAICLAAICSAQLRRAASRQRHDLRRTLGQAETVAEHSSFESLLKGPSRLGSLVYELERSRRHSREFALLVLQPDESGRGALEGDRTFVMAELARTIGSELRAIDVAFLRDEWSYFVILPETAAEGARVAAERIRLSLVAHDSGELGHFSASIGIAVFPDDASSNEDLADSAIRALARAIELGGNRTVLARVPDEAPAGWGLLGSTPPATP